MHNLIIRSLTSKTGVILCVLIHSYAFGMPVASELWSSSRGYLQRTQAPSIHFFHPELELVAPRPVPLYRDFMRHYNERLMAAADPAEVDQAKKVESNPLEASPEPKVSDSKPNKDVRVFHAGGATLRGPYSFPRPQHKDRLFDEIYLHFPVAFDQKEETSIQGELNQSAVFEPLTAVIPSSSSSYLQVP